MASTSAHIIDIPFQEQERRLLSQLNAMRERDQLCDMTIRVGTHEFRCHQAVLAASSAHFRSVFIQGVLSFPKILDLTFTSADVFSIILDYVYTARLKCPTDVLTQVLQAAKVLEIHTLVDHLLLFSAALENRNNASNKDMAQTCTNSPVPSGQPTCTNSPVLAVQPTCTKSPVPSGQPTCSISPGLSAQPCTNLPGLLGLEEPTCTNSSVPTGQPTCTKSPGLSGLGQPTCTSLPVPSAQSSLPVPSGVNTPVSTPDSGVQDNVVVKLEEQEYDQDEIGPWSEDSRQEGESMGRQVTELRAEVAYLRQQLRTAMGDQQHLRTAMGDQQQLRTAMGDQQQLRTAMGDQQQLRTAMGDHQQLRTAMGDHQQLRTVIVDHQQLRTASRVLPPLNSPLMLAHDPGPGMTELLPGSGVYISQSDLQLLVITASYSGRQLCHNLFDHFYRNVDLSRYTAFPHRNGTVGKIALDQNILEAILGFVLKMTTEEKWNADVTKGQIHRIFGNKCTAALRGIKRRLVTSCI